MHNKNNMSKSKKEAAKSTPSSIPQGAHALAAYGKRTEQIVYEFFIDESPDSGLFTSMDRQKGLQQLAEAFKEGWSDEHIAETVKFIAEAEVEGRTFDIKNLVRWIQSHKNEPTAVKDCMTIVPPEQFNIIKVLSRAGSQKLVFLATWNLTTKQVVLKTLLGTPEETQKIKNREIQSNPLSLRHRNIIETFYFQNSCGEHFFVEEYLPVVLNDRWDSQGIKEAANLLYDIGNALKILHEELQLVHGDVKPDNIGKKDDDYILLDFGICRRKEVFEKETGPTGSLRTRAPELFIHERYTIPEKVDIWALGATIFNALTGRFPLYEKGEAPPRVSHPEERLQFENILKERVTNEYDKRVNFDGIPAALKKILKSCLEFDPDKRVKAVDLISSAKTELAAFIRSDENVRLSPIDIIDQLDKFLPSNEVIRYMPSNKKQQLRKQIEEFNLSMGLTNEYQQKIRSILMKIS
jgi:serine/threonine protein kinase